MNIKAVIVDELPKSAIYCPMFEALRFERRYELQYVHVKCNILGATWTTNFFDYQKSRCPGCPLVTDGSEFVRAVKPVKVIYNGITTIAIFSDGQKIISRPNEGEWFDKETGLAMCIAKRVYGGRGQFLKAVEGATVQAVKSEDSYSMNWVEALNEIVNSLSRFVAENKKEMDEQ